MKLSIKEVYKYRTRFTIFGIRHRLKEIDPEELITDLFVQTQDPVAKELIKRFESQLVLAATNFEKFKIGLHRFFEDTANMIKKEKLYKEFFEFVHFIYVNYTSRLLSSKIEKEIVNAYQDLLIEQYSYLKKDFLIYGVSTKGKPLARKEIFPKLDYPYYELMKKYGKNYSITFEELQPRFKKYGYDITEENHLKALIYNEQMITNMLFQLTHFIDENYEDMIPEPFYPVAYPPELPRIWKSTDFYKEKLKEKNYLLPPKGIKLSYYNAGDITEILFKEKFVGDRIVLLYKVKFSKKYIAGFYDNKYEIGYSPWAYSSGEENAHTPLESFILENYLYLTTNFKPENAEENALVMIEEGEGLLFKDQPVAIYRTGKKKDQGKEKEFDREKENLWIANAEIRPFIRRLPTGAKASEEAKKRAQELGYILGEGETFVRPHKKKVYKK